MAFSSEEIAEDWLEAARVDERAFEEAWILQTRMRRSNDERTVWRKREREVTPGTALGWRRVCDVFPNGRHEAVCAKCSVVVRFRRGRPPKYCAECRRVANRQSDKRYKREIDVRLRAERAARSIELRRVSQMAMSRVRRQMWWAGLTVVYERSQAGVVGYRCPRCGGVVEQREGVVQPIHLGRCVVAA